MEQEHWEVVVNNEVGTVEHVLWSLETGCESVWLAIEGGGYDGEFSPDYSLDNCIEKDLIQELISWV